MLGKTNGDVKLVKRMHVSAFVVRKTIHMKFISFEETKSIADDI